MYVYSNNFIEKKIFEVALLCNHHLCESISYNVNLLCTYDYIYVCTYVDDLRIYRYVHRYTYIHNHRAVVCVVIYPNAGFLPGGKTTVCLYSIRRIFILQAYQ